MFFNGGLNSVHYGVKNIKFWHKDIKYFLRLDFLINFDIRIKNRLKNLFLKKFGFLTVIWHELEKMIKVRLVNFSEDLIYKSNCAFGFSLLSRFLLNFYLTEFDQYVFNFAKFYNFRKIAYIKFLNENKLYNFYNESLSGLIPLKMEDFLSSKKYINNVIVEKHKLLGNFYNRHFLFKHSDFVFSFYRAINYVRYLNYSFFGLIGSLNFSLFLKRKFFFYLRSNLGFDIKFVQISLSNKKNITFCGFNIRFLKLKANSEIINMNYIKTNKKYMRKVLSRLRLNQNRLSKVLIRNFYSQLFLELEKAFQYKNFNNLLNYNYRPFGERKFWNYAFQLEAIRSAQSFHLINYSTREKSLLISKQIFSKIRFSDVYKYELYCFNLYNVNLQLLLKEITSDFSSIFGSVLPIDMSLNSYLQEFRKKIFIYYNNFYFGENFILKNEMSFLKKFDPLFPVLNIVNLNLTKNSCFTSVSKSLNPYNYKKLVLKTVFYGLFIPMFWNLV